MFELSLNQRKLKCDFNLQLVNAFKEPIVFYLMDKRDKRSFFLSFVIVDASKQEVIFLDTYSKDNLDIYNKLESDEQFVLKRTPHRSVVAVTGKKFYTFVQDERFFFCVDCSSLKMQVMTLDERIGDKNYKIQKISASIFYDYYNNNYLYISAIDTEQNLHIYHASIDLQEIVEIYTEKGHRTTPHSIVNYKNHLYLSHDFGNVDFRNKRKNEISNSDQIVEGLDMQVIKKRIMNRNTNSSEKEMREEVVKEFFNDKNYEVERGKIALLDLNTFQMKTYYTSGASPAHFEFDFEKDYIYIVSHNFFGWEGRNIFISPAIIDKFKITDDGLVLLNRFSYAKGFRYATHKLFYRDKKCYICTMAQPNRLIVVDASTMKLVFYYDIGEDKLSDKNNVRDYLNSNNSHDEIVAVLASKDGNYLVLISNIYIYYFDIEKRSIAQKIKYNEEGKDWVIRTVHKDIIRYISKIYGNFVVALARSKQPIICDKEGIPYYN